MIEFSRRLSALILAVFLLTGFTLSFVMPPFQVPDEDAHWTSAVIRSETLLGGGKEFCSTALGLPEHFGAQRLAWHPEQKILTGRFAELSSAPVRCATEALNYGNVLSYPGVLVAKVLLIGKLSEPKYQLLQLYLARLFHGLLIFWMLYRFRDLSFGKDASGTPGALTVLSFALSPLFAQQAFGVSSDVTINAFSISLLTFLLHWKRLARIDWIAFALLGLCASITKPTIIPAVGAVTLAIGLIHHNEITLGRWKRNRKFGIFAALAGFVMILGITTALSHQPGHHGEASPVAQRQYVLEHPLQALGTILGTVIEKMHPTMLFHPLGWMDTYLPSQSVSIWIALMVLLIALDLAVEWPWRSRDRHDLAIGIAAVAETAVGLALSAGLVGYFLYLVWTPVGAGQVDGLQGRYFFGHAMLFVGVVFAAFAGDRGIVRRSTSSPIPGNRTFLLNGAVGIIGFVLLFSWTKSLLAVAQRFW